MRRFTIYVCAAVLIITCGQRTKAEGLHAVRPLAGYACMMLNLTDAQMRDKSLVVPVYAGPSTTGGRVGNASAIVIAKSPLHIVNGFAEMLFPNGATVWIDAKMLRPYHSDNNPNAHCTPSLMSNGKPGLG